MPFLYNLIFNKLQDGRKETTQGNQEDSQSNCSDESEEEIDFNITKSPTVECGRDQINKSRAEKREKRSHMIAKTMVSTIAFGQNRRCNALQVWNSVVFLACGVTERLNDYCHHIGLCSSRKTTHKAPANIGKQAQQKIKSAMSINPCIPLSPLVCIDNIDFEEKKHSQSPENTSHMFHGTWGYINMIDKQLFERFDPKDFSIKRYKDALQEAEHVKITPSMFIPTFEENLHFSKAIKSQITRTLLQYLVTVDTTKDVPLDPPSIDQIKPQKPDIRMLKLMLASDNLAEGIGDVLDDIVCQSGLSEEQYSSYLRVSEGDLGSALNLESLQSQRKPSGHAETSLGNTFMLLGASHTLWNFAQALFLMHFGDPSNREDLGAWSTLEALGLPSDQPLAKKDFTLMLNNIQKVHEVTLIHCLMFVMGASQKHLSNKKMKLSPERVKVVVDSCYDCFFSKKALTNALKLTSPKLKNLLLRLRDFGTIIEADRAMKAGDVGRLLNIWRRWSVMAQGIKGLSHHSISLPRMIMLITRVLSPGMRHVLQHSLLMSPSGRAKHFVAKDFFLKVQNYWLKYFYNHNGVGSDSKRLRDVFSLNVPLLQTLVQSIKEDSGVAVSHQSHKHIISLQAINAFLRMAVSKSIHNGSSVELVKTHKPVNDIMHLGILAMQADPLTGGAMLSRLNPSTNLLEQTFHSTNENPDENSLFDNPDHEMGDSLLDPDNELNIRMDETE